MAQRSAGGGGPVAVIVNAAAGRGRGARLLPRVREAFLAVGVRDIQLTTAPRDEMELARRAIARGCTTLVAVGGDGTWSNVANAILAAGAGADCRLALLATGTGNDFVKSVNAPANDFALTARLALDGPDHRIDVGRVADRWFVNALGFGFDAAVIEDAARVHWMGGRLLYLYSALRQLFAYRGLDIGISRNGTTDAPRRRMMLVIANAAYFGGAFRIAPAALVDDGQLDIVAIDDVPASRRLPLLAAAARGAHVRRSDVRIERTEAVTLRFTEPPAYDRDGEYERAKASVLEVRCVPKALRVVVRA